MAGKKVKNRVVLAVECHKCGSKKLSKYGTVMTATGGLKQKWYCKKCGCITRIPIGKGKKDNAR